jgi:ribonuclease D
MEYQLIDSDDSLLEICKRFSGSTWLAIDTEFEREKTFYPELCLIQVANSSEVAVIDPLSLGNLQPLFDLLYDVSITKVFHAARQDLEIFFNLQGAIPQPLFDTQIAAPLIGYDEQMGYANLVNKMLGIELSKAYTRTDWKRRPLQEAQLQYAADDVIYLGQLYTLMLDRLIKHERSSWLDDDFSALSDSELYHPDPNTMWKKNRAAKKLKGSKLCALQHLTAWRERKARAENRPRNWLMRDDALVDIAQLQPKTLSDLGRLKAMNERTVERYGNEIIKIISEAQQQTPMSLNKKESRKPLNIQEEAKVDVMTAMVRLIANKNNLHPNILAPRKELEKFAHNDRDSILLKGWRAQLIGKELQAFLQGKFGFQVIDNKVVITEL